MQNKTFTKSETLLSDVEQELLIAIACGTPHEQIELQLQMESSAILAMKNDVMHKLNASNWIEALAYCRNQAKLLPEEICLSFN